MCNVKNRLALLFFAVLLAVPMAQAQRRRPSAPPPPQQESACALKTLLIGTYSADQEVDDTYVYFTDSANGIFRMPKNGGDPQTLAILPDNFITVLAIDDTTVYALTIGDDNLTLGSCWSVAKTGGTPKQLAATILTPFELAVDANYVYWVSIGTPTDDGFLADGKVERIRKDGTGRTTLASNLNVPVMVATDGTTVFFTETGLSPANSSAGLRSVPANGGTIRTLTTRPGVVGVTLSGNDVYFANLDFNTGGELLRMPKSGGTATSLAKGLDVVTHLVVLGDRLYYFNSDDVWSIESIPLAGGPRHQIVGNADLLVEEFAIDDCGVYYVNGQGSLIRTPR